MEENQPVRRHSDRSPPTREHRRTIKRRSITHGLELWRTDGALDWSHWDLWFCVVLLRAFGGDWDAFATELRERTRGPGFGALDAEARLSHLGDLRRRLEAAGLTAQALCGDGAQDRKLWVKAERKVLEASLDRATRTRAMIETPRFLLRRRALFGRWKAFPVSPVRYHRDLAELVPADFVTKRRSSGATRRLRKRIERLDGQARDAGERLAIFRAFHTAGVELAERVDDSHGSVGELRLDAFRAYVDLDWRSTGIAPEAYWEDLCDLLCEECFALCYRNETLPFRGVQPDEARLVERTLLDLWAEARDADLTYRAEEALNLLAWLQVAGHRLSHYALTARRLGSDHWVPVVAMARSALESGRADVAYAVFRGADQPGMHRAFLRGECRKLTGRSLPERS
jgi:hypothetical protein